MKTVPVLFYGTFFLLLQRLVETWKVHINLFEWKWHRQFHTKKETLRKTRPAFQQVKEQLLNLWDMWSEVLKPLKFFFFFYKMCRNEANYHTFALFFWSSLDFSKDIFQMFSKIYLDQYLQIHRIFVCEEFWDLKCEILCSDLRHYYYLLNIQNYVFSCNNHFYESKIVLK